MHNSGAFKMTIGVYTIVHAASRKCYVGSSINVEQRLIHHRSKLNRGKHHCRHLQNAWIKYGSSAFEFVLSRVTESEQECRDLEQAVLDTFFDCMYNSKNAAVGGGTGDLNVMRRPEVAKKVSEARIGMKFSDDHRRNLSAALKGKPSTRLGSTASLESKEKMRVAKLGKTSPRKGCVLSLETVEKMIASKTGKKIGPYKTLTCPHCDKVGAGGAMRQWHFEKCKSKG
jgi:group I intron endonuclease